MLITNIPQHVAIIMDGNGRWAERKGLPRIFGHRAGVRSVKRAIKFAIKIGIKILTLYAFSTENWSRPQSEILGLMTLLREYIKKESDTLKKNNIRLRVLGDLSKIPNDVRISVERIISETQNNTGLILNIALNYGSRQEIVMAVNKIIEDKLQSIDEQKLSEYLYTSGLPDPDLLIRTSGEYRLSNFLLWQIAYTELYFTKTLWPDFDEKEFLSAIKDYNLRKRRFGGI